jgi:hypothetical protein
MAFAQKIVGFLGITPRTSERLVTDMAAQVAENVDLLSGEIRPIRPPLLANSPSVYGVKLAAYRAYNGVTEKWRTWDTDVDVAVAPLSPDVEQRYYWTGDGCPRYATFTNFGTTDWALGIPNPTAKPSASATGGVGSTINRAYCYTLYQPSTGEETGPSPVGDIASGKADGTWTITGFSGTPTNDRAVSYNTSGLYQRLYRTSGTSADFQLVSERAVATTDWTDTVLDAAMMGDSLLSSGWLPPPVDLKGLITLPNGCMVGFHGNELCYSEPYQPHAWPDANKNQTESVIVGIESFGTAVVACTKTRPYVFDGVTPDVVTGDKVNKIWPCLSKRSVCAVGDGVIYSTNTGMVYVGSAGPRIWTEGLYTLYEWEKLAPSTFVCVMSNDKVYALHTPVGSAYPSLLQIAPSEKASLTVIGTDATELYADSLDGNLYLVKTEVYQYNGTPNARSTFVWRSKAFELPVPVNLGVGLIEYVGELSVDQIASGYAQIITALATNQTVITVGTSVGAFRQINFADAPIGGAMGIAPIPSKNEFLKYTLYADGKAVATIDVLSGKTFRLPGGYTSDVLTHELTGNVRVRYLKVSENMEGLKLV